MWVHVISKIMSYGFDRIFSFKGRSLQIPFRQKKQFEVIWVNSLTPASVLRKTSSKERIVYEKLYGGRMITRIIYKTLDYHLTSLLCENSTTKKFIFYVAGWETFIFIHIRDIQRPGVPLRIIYYLRFHVYNLKILHRR